MQTGLFLLMHHPNLTLAALAAFGVIKRERREVIVVPNPAVRLDASLQREQELSCSLNA